jgi:hypothetical protein
VIIDKRLLWDKHIEKICKKVGAGIAVMKRIKPFVPIETMRLIYNALYSHILITVLPYGIIVVLI